VFEKIEKRDGRVVDFDSSKITAAIAKAGNATGEFSERDARKLTLRVLTLSHDLRLGPTPKVEEIQDIVERVLLDSPFYKTAKAYILYREQHAQIRKIATRANVDLVNHYIEKLDWKIRENSNMSYSLQGLNNYISSEVTSEYWLNSIYPPEIRQAHAEGDLHIHDLNLLAVYCVGWDLMDLLRQGFKGVEGKVESSPPRHLRSALGQIVNFFYTLQGEAAGAQAISNFDTLLAPFVRYDRLEYREVKQALQEFIFNINIPTRVGFQCLSEDTDILTPDGWMGYADIEVGQTIKTFNIHTGAIEDQPVEKIFARPYSGEMYQLKNRIQDQLISPGHRVVRKKFNTDDAFVLEEIEKVATYKSPVIIPVTGKNINPEKNISDDEIRLLAWIIAEGSKESYTKNRHCHRITIYQSKIKSPENYDEIIGILNRMGLTYTNRDSVPALGTSSQMIRLNAEGSQKILDNLFETRTTVKFIPNVLKNMSRRQARLFLETYLKADGHEGTKITTTNIEILNGLQQIAVDAEYGFTVGTRKPTIGKKMLHVLRLIDHQDTYIQTIRKVDYSGVIWCPSTANETVIARRNGKVFITGNTPFTNITLDLHPPAILKNTPVVVGGVERPETYAEFQPEMDAINRAFAEVMMEGDAKGRVFTFPIPTYNLTADFDWENSNLEPLWRMTGKYGIPYFSNFINSEMSPEDARSMCCRLRLDNRELLKRGGGLFGANPLTGSVGVVTLNLPRMGYLSQDEKDFFARLRRQVQLAADSLTLKRKVLEQFTDKNLYPYSKFYLREIKKSFGIYWKNHFSTIGIIGMNEACLNFLGKDITTETGQAFALRVMDFLRETIAGLQETTGTLFNLEATPGEGTSYRLAMLDKQRFAKIICANETEVRRGSAVPYYTNSSQLPVGYTDDLFETLRLQDDLQCKYTGGTVLHIFLGEQVKDTAVIRNLVRKIASSHRLPYFTLTPTFSICPTHGYLDGEQPYCRQCSEATEVYSRVVGYLRPVKQWNSGKQAEFGDRKSVTVAS
jgi:ribonucleoside-triphosphate reductase (formate)